VDWVDDALFMGPHYSRYQPLFDQIDNYLINNNEIKTVYLAGHSLGGQMAMRYLKDHPNAGGIEYLAVTFEGANKGNDSSGDDRYTNFEMRGDVVPDLMFHNYGDTIHLEYEVDGLESWNPKTSIPIVGNVHTRETIEGSINENDSHLGSVFDALARIGYTAGDARIYVDTNANGIIETHSQSPYGVKTIDAGLDYFTLFFGSLGVIGIEETRQYVSNVAYNDGAEYFSTGYNFTTSYDFESGGTLVINPIEKVVDNTFVSDDLAVHTIIVKGEFGVDEDINITGSPGTHNITGNAGDNILDISASDVASTGIRFVAGGAGNDKLVGSNGNDILFGDDYYDRFQSLSLPFLSGGLIFDRSYVENSVFTDLIDLINFGYTDEIVGGGGDDIIAGGAGNDLMSGGTGNDVYLVENSGDIIIENVGEGLDSAVVFSRFIGDQIEAINAFDNVENIIIADAIGEVNISVVSDKDDDTDRVIIGNSDVNVLVGGAGDDLLVGGSNLDILIGGDGSDILYGGQYKEIANTLVNPLDSSIVGYINEFADEGATDDVDVSLLIGGQGSDLMIGGYAGADGVDKDGDNDFFFIDVNSNNNVGNEDLIQNFYVASALTDISAEDYLVFSAAQLNLTLSELSGFSRKSIDSTTESAIWDDSVTNEDLNAYVVPFFGFEHFIKVDGIDKYSPESSFTQDEDFAFVLDHSNGDLYFDRNGDKDVGDQYLVANISTFDLAESGGLDDMNGNQILILEDFDLV
jgi:Ca2+-binding RTX toxin-like protein